MGKSDIIARQYLRDNAVFADVFNYLLYDGREVLQPSKLHTLDSAIPVTLSREKEKASIHKLRDVYKIYSAKTDGNLAYPLLGIEHQTELHYAMPVQAMLYDALSYEQQLSDIARRHSKSRDYRGHTPAEYLSGFYKEDRLIPVITVVLMLSPVPWNGPTELHQIIHVPDPTLLPMIENYKLHLIAPAHLTKDNVNKFKSSLREVLGFIKYSENPDQLESLVKNNPRFERIDRDVAMVIKTCTNSAFDIDPDRNTLRVYHYGLKSQAKINERRSHIICVKP